MKLTFNQEEPFRILQFTDLHLRELPFDEKDLQTLQMIESLIYKEQPDLVIFTGDMVWGTIIENPLATFEEFLNFCNLLEVPIALTYGNHDTNHASVNRALFRMNEQKLVNQVNKSHRIIFNHRENYVIELYDKKGMEIQQVLFVLDSGEYLNNQISRYEWMLPEQVEWLRKTMLFYRQEYRVKQSLVFQHIPVHEYMDAYQFNHPGNGVTEGFRVDSPGLNTGLFATLLLDESIKGLIVGHNHNNNFQTNYLGLELIFGQVSGYGADADIQRGARLIELSKNTFQSKIIYDE